MTLPNSSAGPHILCWTVTSRHKVHSENASHIKLSLSTIISVSWPSQSSFCCCRSRSKIFSSHFHDRWFIGPVTWIRPAIIQKKNIRITPSGNNGLAKTNPYKICERKDPIIKDRAPSVIKTRITPSMGPAIRSNVLINPIALNLPYLEYIDLQ